MRNHTPPRGESIGRLGHLLEPEDRTVELHGRLFLVGGHRELDVVEADQPGAAVTHGAKATRRRRPIQRERPGPVRAPASGSRVGIYEQPLVLPQLVQT